MLILSYTGAYDKSPMLLGLYEAILVPDYYLTACKTFFILRNVCGDRGDPHTPITRNVDNDGEMK